MVAISKPMLKPILPWVSGDVASPSHAGTTKSRHRLGLADGDGFSISRRVHRDRRMIQGND